MNLCSDQRAQFLHVTLVGVSCAVPTFTTGLHTGRYSFWISEPIAGHVAYTASNMALKMYTWLEPYLQSAGLGMYVCSATQPVTCMHIQATE
jgi:hypothetical protein